MNATTSQECARVMQEIQRNKKRLQEWQKKKHALAKKKIQRRKTNTASNSNIIKMPHRHGQYMGCNLDKTQRRSFCVVLGWRGKSI